MTRGRALAVPRQLTPLVAALALMGCSGAAPGPVRLLDGEYEVSMSGQVPSAIGTHTATVNDPPPKVCLSSTDDASKIDKLVRTYYDMGVDCVHRDEDRSGDQVSGNLQCSADPVEAPGGQMRMSYTGTLTADSVRLEGKLQIELHTANVSAEDFAMMENGKAEFEKTPIVAEAKRIGECS